MKTKLIYLIGFIFICILSCSKDDNNPEKPCFLQSVFLSDNCECNFYDFNCGELKFISEAEYQRILNLQMNSPEPCFFVQSFESSTELPIEGFLININKSECDFDFEI